MIYRAYNITRKEYIEGSFNALARWLAALVCNDMHSGKVGRWCGDRIVLQAVDAQVGRQCYVSASTHRHCENITPLGGIEGA